MEILSLTKQQVFKEEKENNESRQTTSWDKKFGTGFEMNESSFKIPFVTFLKMRL